MKQYLVAVALFLIGFVSFSQQDIEVELEVIENLTNKGDYKASLFRAKNLGKTLSRENKDHTQFYLHCLSYRLYCENKLDRTDEYESSLEQFQKLYLQLKETDDYNGLFESLIHIIQLNNENGSTLISLKYLNDASEYKSKLSIYHQKKLEYYITYSNFQRGYLNTILDQIEQQIEVAKAYATDLKDKEGEEEAYLLYGQLVLLQTETLIKQGMYTQAFDLLAIHKHDLKLHLKKNYQFLSSFYYIEGVDYFKKGEYRKAEKDFKRASAVAKSYYRDHSTAVTDIQHDLIDALLAQGKVDEANYYNNDVDIKVIGYYKRNSLTYLHNTYSDIENQINNSYWGKCEVSLVNFLLSDLLPKHHFYREKALKDLIYVSCKNNKFERADSLLKVLEEVQVVMYGFDSPLLDLTHINRAYILTHYFDRFNESSVIYDQLVNKKLQKNIKVSHPQYIQYIIDKSKLYFHQERFDIAKSNYHNALSQLEKSEESKDISYAVLSSEYAALLFELGEYKQAENYINLSLTIFNQKIYKHDITHRIRALEVKAQLLVLSGDFSALESYANRISELSSNNSNKLIFVTSFSEELGWFQIQLGNYYKAQKLLDKALVAKEKTYGKTHKELVNVLNYLGLLYNYLGDYEKASEYINRSSAISNEKYGDNSFIHSKNKVYQKKLFDVLGDYKKSYITINQSITNLKKHLRKDNVKLAILEHEYVLAKAHANKDTNQTLSLNQLNHSLQVISSEMGDQSGIYAIALENASRYYLYIDEVSKALIELKLAQSIWKEINNGNNINIARLNLLIGNIYHKEASHTIALNFVNEATEQYKRLFNENHPDYISALGKKSQLQYATGDLKGAVKSIRQCVKQRLVFIDKVFPLLSQRGKSAFLKIANEDFEFYKNIAFTRFNEYPEMISEVVDLQLQTRAILLNTQLKVKRKILFSGNEEAIALYDELLEKREEIAKVYSMSPSKRKEDGINLNHLEAEIEKLEKKLNGISDDFSSTKDSKNLSTWKNLRDKLQDDESYLEIIPFTYFSKNFTDTIWYATISIDKTTKSEKDIGFVVNKKGNYLNNKAKRFYDNALKFRIKDKKSGISYWDPIVGLLKPNTNTIIIVNDGVYNHINLETILDHDDQYLINKYRFVNVITGRDVLSREEPKTSVISASSSVELFGNPQYYSSESDDQSWSQLEGAEKEVKLIDELLLKEGWSSKLTIYADATEHKIKKLNSPTVLHVSTHGTYLSQNKKANKIDDYVNNPLLKSCLLFKNGGEILDMKSTTEINSSPGVLTAYEAMNLSLDKTELVILSACETGVGKVQIGEGVMGLQSAFLVAGGKSVITSLFKVSDEITQKLMITFYEKWLETGDKQEAFREAKKVVMKENPSPIYWGAFTMIGIN